VTGIGPATAARVRFGAARRALAHELAGFGWGYWEIADFLDVSPYTMYRYFTGSEWPDLARMP
jgi:hypothetical protein